MLTADSGNYVYKDGGKVKLKVCPAFAATLFENCNVDSECIVQAP